MENEYTINLLNSEIEQWKQKWETGNYKIEQLNSE